MYNITCMIKDKYVVVLEFDSLIVGLIIDMLYCYYEFMMA